MKKESSTPDGLSFQPLTKEHWPDFERLFGPMGACGGCWCMWWRLKRSEFEKLRGEGNRKAIKALVDSGHVPGILALANGESVGWCSVAPRESFPVLDRSPVLKRVDQAQVWSVVCFVIRKDYRNQGLSGRLLTAALDHVRSQGGKIVEGYPVEPKKEKVAPSSVYTGLASTFRRVGFKEVARRSEAKSIMRCYL